MRKILMLLFLVIFGITLVSCGDDESNISYRETTKEYNDSNILQKVTIKDFDKNGNVTVNIIQNFNEDGLRVKQFVYTYEYDEKGNCIKVFCDRYNSSDEPVESYISSEYKYEYNELNQIVSKIHISYYVYSNITEKQYFNYFYEYDANGNVVSETFKRGSSTSQSMKKYDTNNNLIEEYTISNMLSISKNTLELYEYDSSNKVIKYSKYEVIDDVRKIVTMEEYEYNEYGYMIKQVTKSNTASEVINYTYTYNADGKITTKKYQNYVITYEYR